MRWRAKACAGELEVVNIAGLARFSAFLSDRDVLLDPARAERDPEVLAVDRSGGVYRVIVPGGDRAPGVWHDSSEGERHLIAGSPRDLFALLGRGFTIDDLIAGRASASGRPAPGLLAWAETLKDADAT